MKTLPRNLMTISFVGALLVTTPAASAADSHSSSPSMLEVKDRSIVSAEDLLNYDSFDTTTGRSSAKVSSLGEQLGPGISESIPEGSRGELEGMVSAAGKETLPEGTAALRYMDSGEIFALNNSGDPIAKVSGITTSSQDIYDQLSLTDAGAVAVASGDLIHPEVKRIIGACIGIGLTGAVTAEDIVQHFNTPSKAAKFVVRRLGVFGAVSCAGGIIWEYL